VSQDFPLVICAELEAVEEAKQRLVKCLQAVTGVAPPQAPVSPQEAVHIYEDGSKKTHLKMNEVLGPISSGLSRPPLMPPLCWQAAHPLSVSEIVEPGKETEVVRPITRDNQTPENPFTIQDAGICTSTSQ
jgi:hypothetical protein